MGQGPPVKRLTNERRGPTPPKLQWIPLFDQVRTDHTEMTEMMVSPIEFFILNTKT